MSFPPDSPVFRPKILRNETLPRGGAMSTDTSRGSPTPDVDDPRSRRSPAPSARRSPVVDLRDDARPRPRGGPAPGAARPPRRSSSAINRSPTTSSLAFALAVRPAHVAAAARPATRTRRRSPCSTRCSPQGRGCRRVAQRQHVHRPSRRWDRSCARCSCPAVGGDTCFASMYAAYEASVAGDARVRRRPARGTRHHEADPQGASRRSLAPSTSARCRRSARRSSTRWCVIHPETGRKALFVNRNSTTHLVGSPNARTTCCCRSCSTTSRSPEFQCRFHWEAGSLAFWDNRTVQHYARRRLRRAPHHAPGHDRLGRSSERAHVDPSSPITKPGCLSEPGAVGLFTRLTRVGLLVDVVPAPLLRPLRPAVHRLLGPARAAARRAAVSHVAHRARGDPAAVERRHHPDPRPARARGLGRSAPDPADRRKVARRPHQGRRAHRRRRQRDLRRGARADPRGLSGDRGRAARPARQPPPGGADDRAAGPTPSKCRSGGPR